MQSKVRDVRKKGEREGGRRDEENGERYEKRERKKEGGMKIKRKGRRERGREREK